MKKIWQKMGLHLVWPPRLEGSVLKGKMKHAKKEKKEAQTAPYHREPKVHIDAADKEDTDDY